VGVETRVEEEEARRGVVSFAKMEERDEVEVERRVWAPSDAMEGEM
jgi:hypothetical protein